MKLKLLNETCSGTTPRVKSHEKEQEGVEMDSFLATLLRERRNLIHMEDQIQLTNIFKTLIQGLHKNLGNKEKQKKKRNQNIFTSSSLSHLKVKGSSRDTIYLMMNFRINKTTTSIRQSSYYPNLEGTV